MQESSNSSEGIDRSRLFTVRTRAWVHWGISRWTQLGGRNTPSTEWSSDLSSVSSHAIDSEALNESSRVVFGMAEGLGANALLPDDIVRSSVHSGPKLAHLLQGNPSAYYVHKILWTSTASGRNWVAVEFVIFLGMHSSPQMHDPHVASRYRAWTGPDHDTPTTCLVRGSSYAWGLPATSKETLENLHPPGSRHC